jgi:prepilin-type N-terminal cleavage/methylation domain-containing protein
MSCTNMCNVDEKSGFTIVEVIVALLILGLCIGGLCQMAVNARQLSDMSRSHYTAINIAKNRLERAKTFDYDELAFLAESLKRVDASGRPDQEGTYRVNTLVRAAGSNLTELVVSVDILSPMSLDFEGESESIQTYVADIPKAN